MVSRNGAHYTHASQSRLPRPAYTAHTQMFWNVTEAAKDQLMTPSELRALQGKVLIPTVKGRGAQTIRYRVVGFSGDTVRVLSPNGQRSTIAVADLRQAFTRELLAVEDN